MCKLFLLVEWAQMIFLCFTRLHVQILFEAIYPLQIEDKLTYICSINSFVLSLLLEKARRQGVCVGGGGGDGGARKVHLI